VGTLEILGSEKEEWEFLIEMLYIQEIEMYNTYN